MKAKRGGMFDRTSKLSAIVLIALATASGSAAAATATTTMSVSLIIQAGCSVSATALNFGTASVLSAQIGATADVNVVCTDETAYTIGLDLGGNSLSGQRRMIGPAAETVMYDLYRDSGHATPWGNTIGTNTVAGTGTGNTQLYIVYGLIPAPQPSPDPGGYADLVNVTVTY